MFRIDFTNPWIIAVKAARRPFPAWLAMIVAPCAVALAVFGGRALVAHFDVPAMSPFWRTVTGQAVSYIAIFGPIYGFVALAGAGVEGRRRPVGGAPALAGLIGFSFGAGGLALAVGLLIGAGIATPAAHAAEAGGALWLGLGLSAVLVLFQAGAEEVLFRGWLQPLLAAAWGPWVGLLSTAALFSIVHQFAGPSGLLAMINTALAGLLFGLLALRTGSLWAPIAAHAAWNWGEQSIAGLLPNPGVAALGSLFDWDLAGPAWLSGGGDALNGSAATTLALGVAIVGVGLLRGKTGDAGRLIP